VFYVYLKIAASEEAVIDNYKLTLLIPENKGICNYRKEEILCYCCIVD